MRNAANKMMNPIDPCTENHFWSFIEISEQNGSLCGFHSGSLWLSFVQKALARLATSQLHSRSLSHSGTDMWILAFKIFSLPVPSRPATRSFCHYPTRSRPEVKNHYPSVSDRGSMEQFPRHWKIYMQYFSYIYSWAISQFFRGAFEDCPPREEHRRHLVSCSLPFAGFCSSKPGDVLATIQAGPTWTGEPLASGLGS